MNRAEKTSLLAEAASQMLGIKAEDEDLFARLGLAAENLYLSGPNAKAFAEEFEQGLVGGAFFSGSRDSDLEGLAESAKQAGAAGAGHDLDSKLAAMGSIGDFQSRKVGGHGLKSICG